MNMAFINKQLLIIAIALGLIVLTPPSANAADCEKGHRIKQVIDNGQILILEDNSIWEINVADSTDTEHWRTGAKIIVCESKLINTDKGESAKGEKEKEVENDEKKEKEEKEEDQNGLD